MINRFSIVTLVFFLISAVFVIKPRSFSVPLPYLGRRRVCIDLTTAPIFAIALLWAAQCLGATQIRNGIVGTDDIKPYNILILFITLAYMAISLDITGVLEAAAYWVSNKGGSNTRKLFFYFYVMLTLISVVLGNDPVILSGTAFLVYYTKAVELEPLAWLMSEFAAANTSSMVLFVGNPTNVVICEGFLVNNVAFTAYTILPFLACSVSCFVALFVQFRSKRYLPKKIEETKELNPRDVLRDPVGAWVGSFVLGSCLIVIIIVSFFKVDVWKISLPFAGAKFIFDLVWDHHRFRTRTFEDQTNGFAIAEQARSSETESALSQNIDVAHPTETPKALALSSDGTDDVSTEKSLITSSTEPNGEGPIERLESFNSHTTGSTLVDPETDNKEIDTKEADTKEIDTKADSKGADNEETDTKADTKETDTTASSKEADTKEIDTKADTKETDTTADTKPVLFPRQQEYIMGKWAVFKNHFPTVATAIPRLPLALIPFAFSQFILIEALSHQGWIDVFADWLVKATRGGQMHLTVWVIGVLGVLLCNLAGTNIGATILLTKIVRAAPNFPKDSERAAAIALAIASNIGAVSFVFSASLAGLLWHSILQEKDIKHITQGTFAFWNLLPLITMTSFGLAVVSAEMAILYR